MLYKYCPPERIDILTSGTVMLSRPEAFNDPFELKPHYGTLEQWVLPISADASPEIRERIRAEQARIDSQLLTPYNVDKIIEARTRSIVILSLCENRDSLLMWAHYARNHTGFLIGFDSEQTILANESPHRLLTPVTYRVGRPSKPTFEELTNEELLHTKGKEWEYEKEWRIIDSSFSADGDPSREAPLCWPFHFRPQAVAEVIVGCRASEDFSARLLGILDKPPFDHVQQKRAFRHRTEYKLRIGTTWEKEW